MSLPKMKITVPDALKADLPQTKWGKLFAATPIVMTVIATMLASLASSEMTKAQYNRSLGSQLQAKAGDQWSLFQAKRLRGSLQRSTIDLLGAANSLSPLSEERILGGLDKLQSPQASALKAELASEDGHKALNAVVSGTLPALPASTPLSESLSSCLRLMEDPSAEPELMDALSKVKSSELDEALKTSQLDAKAQAIALDHVTNLVEKSDRVLAAGRGTPEGARLHTDFTAARLNYNMLRYEAESRLNQRSAQVLELQVRKSNLIAERQHKRSLRYFYGLLLAQVGVIASTFALAAKMKSLLWGLAAAAGTFALAGAAYVYMYL